MTVRYYLTVVGLFLVTMSLTAQPAPKPGARTMKIGILGIQTETEALRSSIAGRKTVLRDGLRFTTGTLKGAPVVLGEIGYGKVNAALGAAVMLNEFGVDCLLLSGTAGALNPDFIQGDVVIATELSQYDFGQVIPNSFVPWQTRNPVDGVNNPEWFPVAEPLLAAARAASGRVHLTRIDLTPGVREPKIWAGPVVTGDLFVSDPAKALELRKRPGADALEMEGAAVAQACYQAGVPFLIIRSLTDRADGSAFLDYNKFLKAASGNSASLIAEIAAEIRTNAPPAIEGPGVKHHWRLHFELAFGRGSPYAKKFPDLYNLPYAEDERISREVLTQIVAIATKCVPVRPSALTFQPGATGDGPVVPSAQLTVTATRQEALTMAAIIGFLAQQTVVNGETDSGPSARRCLLVENKSGNGWDNRQNLRDFWPAFARLAPATASGFSRVRSDGSDRLIIIDTKGAWKRAEWQAFPGQLERIGTQLNTPLKVRASSLVYLEVENLWQNSPGDDYLGVMAHHLSIEQVRDVREAAGGIVEPAITKALRAASVAKGSSPSNAPPKHPPETKSEPHP